MFRQRRYVRAARNGTFRFDDVEAGSYFITSRVGFRAPFSCNVPVTRPGEAFEPDALALEALEPSSPNLAVVELPEAGGPKQ